MFWRNVTTNITKQLRGLPVFESRSGNFRVCSYLTFVPREYRTSDGFHPLIDLQSRQDQHLSFHYDRADDRDPAIIATFGVNKMTTTVFRRDLEEFLGDLSPLVDGRTFTAVDASWRDQVASAFTTRDIKKQKNSFFQMPIIPIRAENGTVTWVNPNSNLFFDNRRIRIDHLAKDLNLRVIDSVLCTGEWKERLVKTLGMCDLEPAAVIQEIWYKHQGDHKRKFLNWVKDIIFLFQARQHIPDDLDLGSLSFLTLGNKRRLHGSEVYLSGCCAMIDKAVLQGAPIHVISEQYTDQLNEKDHAGFCSWITKACGVAREPRLSRDGSVTAHWTYFAQHMGGELLFYLREHPILLQDSSIRQALSGVIVPVRGQAKMKPSGTALPTSELLEACPDISFIDLPDANDKA